MKGIDRATYGASALQTFAFGLECGFDFGPLSSSHTSLHSRSMTTPTMIAGYLALFVASGSRFCS